MASLLPHITSEPSGDDDDDDDDDDNGDGCSRKPPLPSLGDRKPTLSSLGDLTGGASPFEERFFEDASISKVTQKTLR